MALNGFKRTSGAEPSPYQKRIEAIDNVILCVAETETMINDIGQSLVEGIEIAPKKTPDRGRGRRFVWTGRKFAFR